MSNFSGSYCYKGLNREKHQCQTGYLGDLINYGKIIKGYIVVLLQITNIIGKQLHQRSTALWTLSRFWCETLT